MSLTGNGSLSIRKKDVQEQKSLALGTKKLQFAHKTSASDTTIDLTALVTPTEMSSVGFQNPNVSDIVAANIFVFRKNLKLISSLRGELIDFLSYQVASATKINLGFEAEEDEIFVGVFDPKPVTSALVADARSLVATGTLLVGQTDFAVGQPFTINKNPNSQVGDVLVFRNGVLQARNTGNGDTGGNYKEVANGTGLSNLIRFNTPAAGTPDSILVVGNGLIAEKPTGSVLASVESLAGTVDQLVPTVAALAGVPQTNFQSQPSNVDLKQFGDRVLQNEQDILDHENRIAKGLGETVLIKDVKSANTPGGTFTSGAWQPRIINTIFGSASWITLTNGTTGIDGTANQFTLQPGTYLIEGEAPAYSDTGQIDRHKSKLVSDPDGSPIDEIIGSSEYTGGDGGVTSKSKILGVLVLNSITTFQVQHRCQTTLATTGFGIESNFSVVEIYTQLKITKIGL